MCQVAEPCPDIQKVKDFEKGGYHVQMYYSVMVLIYDKCQINIFMSVDTLMLKVEEARLCVQAVRSKAGFIKLIDCLNDGSLCAPTRPQKLQQLRW